MDPFTMMFLGQAIGGGASLLGSFMGASEEEKNRDQNWDIAMLNRSDANRQRQEQIALAEQLRRESQLGGTDAEGNTSKFVPGQGWVSEYGHRPNALLDYFYGTELPAMRSQFGRSDEASRRNDDVAQQFLSQMTGLQQDDPAEIENILFEAATRGAGEQTAETTENALRQALRSGTSNTGDIVSEINKGASKYRGDAARDAKLQARDYVGDKFRTERGDLANLYSAFSAKGAAPLSPSFDPTGMDTNPLMGQFMNMAMNNDSGLRNATATPRTGIPQVQPNMGWANAMGSVGDVASGLGDRLGGMAMEQQNNALLQAFLTGGGQLNLGRGGLFGSMADRVRTGGGGF